MKKIILTVALVTFGVPCAFAANDAAIAKSFVQHGIKSYDQRRYEAAIDDFARALLLDPAQEQAKEYLLALAQNNAIRSESRVYLLMVEDTLSYVDNLTRKVQYYKGKQEILIEELLAIGVDRAQLDKERLSIKRTTVNAEENSLRKFNIENIGEKKPIEVYIALLNYDKERLLVDMKYTVSQYEYLRELNRNIAKYPQFASLARKNAVPALEIVASQPNIRITSMEPEIASANVNVSGPKEPGAHSTDSFTVLQKEVAFVRKQLYDLQRLVNAKDMRVDKLSSEIVDMALQLSESEKELNDKTVRIKKLNDQLNDLQSRFELGERIISERADEIAKLTQSLSDVQASAVERNKEYEKIIASKDEKLFEIDGILQIYKAKFSDAAYAIKEKDASVDALEEQLSFVQFKLFEKDQRLRKTTEELIKLKSQLTAVEEELKRLKQFPATHDKSAQTQFEEEISDLQSRLEDIHKYLSIKLLHSN